MIKSSVLGLLISSADALPAQHVLFTLLVISLLVNSGLVYRLLQMKKHAEQHRTLLMQQELRAQSVISAEEKERSRIVRELYDGIGQQLSAAKLNVSALQSFLKTNNDTDRLMIRNTAELLDDSVKEMRNISHSIIPNTLIKSGIAAAARELVNRSMAAGTPALNLEIVGTIERFDTTQEAVFFRVFHEILHNSVTHASATEIGIQLVKHDQELSLLVEDNGEGFDIDEVMQGSKGSGIRSIQSRVAFLNGSVYFDSRRGRGTTVSIEIPIAASAGEDQRSFILLQR